MTSEPTTTTTTGYAKGSLLSDLGGAIGSAWQGPALVAAAAVSLLVFGFFAAIVGFPEGGPYSALILQQSLGAADLLLAVVLLVVTTAIGTVLCGRIRYDAGWGAALVGLLAWRARGGSVYHTLDDRTTGVFLTMAVELIVLSAVAGGLWWLLHVVRERGAVSPVLKRWLELPNAKAREIDRPRRDESLNQRLVHLGVSFLTCAVVVYLVCQNDDPMQTTAAALFGGWLAALAAHATIPVRPAIWSLGGPVLVGVVGYVTAFLFTPAERLMLGEPGGPLAALARPLPIEWAGAALPAALYGYVRARTKQAQEAAAAKG